MSECSICMKDYHSKQFIHTTCCKQKFCVNCGLKQIKIADIGLPYIKSCPYCRNKVIVTLTELSNWNKHQLLDLIRIYSDRPPVVCFNNIPIHINNDGQAEENGMMMNEDLADDILDAETGDPTQEQFLVSPLGTTQFFDVAGNPVDTPPENV